MKRRLIVVAIAKVNNSMQRDADKAGVRCMLGVMRGTQSYGVQASDEKLPR